VQVLLGPTLITPHAACRLAGWWIVISVGGESTGGSWVVAVVVVNDVLVLHILNHHWCL
jgi:hypothetical protein